MRFKVGDWVYVMGQVGGPWPVVGLGSFDGVAGVVLAAWIRSDLGPAVVGECAWGGGGAWHIIAEVMCVSQADHAAAVKAAWEREVAWAKKRKLARERWWSRNRGHAVRFALAMCGTANAVALAWWTAAKVLGWL